MQDVPATPTNAQILEQETASVLLFSQCSVDCKVASLVTSYLSFVSLKLSIHNNTTMGRVSRYKKIKSFDPYSKQNGGRIVLDTVGIWGLGADGRKAKKRSKTVAKIKEQAHKRRFKEKHGGGGGLKSDFDAPPPEKDDFDLADMFGSLKKQKPVVLQDEPLPKATRVVTMKEAPAPAARSLVHVDQHEEHATRLLKLNSQVDPPKKVVEAGGRMQGESKKAYERRVKTETRQIIRNERMQEHNPEKKKRKKDFLNNKKKNKKRKGKVATPDSDDSDNDDESVEAVEGTIITGEQAVAARGRATAVQFGEQAERPPVFRVIPRGATRKSEFKIKSVDGKKMSKEEIEAEQSVMEKMRRKAQAQYAIVREKRRQNSGSRK